MGIDKVLAAKNRVMISEDPRNMLPRDGGKAERATMEDVERTAFDVLREQAGQIGFGEWIVKLIIYNGEVIGFDQEQAPLIKFRAGAGKKK